MNLETQIELLINKDMNSKETPFMTRLRAIEEAARQIYGNSETSASIERQCAVARADIAAILDRRGVTHPVIAVIGSKNAGKTTLCRMLVRKPEQRQRLAAGFGPDNATRKTVWIGPEAPADLDKRWEQQIPLPSNDLEDLGSPYTLVDVPGFNDDDPAAAAPARRAFRLSTTVVLVASEETTEDHRILKEMSLRDGVRVLPVVVTNKEDELRGAVSGLRKRIRRACPKSEVLDPVMVPRVGSAQGEARDRLEQRLRARLKAAMTPLLSMEAVDAVLLAETRFGRLRETLRAEVRDLVAEVQDEYNHLVETEEQVIEGITRELAGNPRQLKAACRLRLLDSLTDRCPPLFFPYRSFLGLLTLAAGAWDRLVFSLLGSLPSLAMTAVQSGRNARLMAERRQSMRDALARRARALASEKLAPASQAFMRAVKRRLPGDARERLLLTPPEPEVVGLDAAESAVTSAFEEGIAGHSPRNRVNFSLGLVSTALVILLASGPIAVIYRQFHDAWLGGFGPAAAARSEVVLQADLHPAADALEGSRESGVAPAPLVGDHDAAAVVANVTGSADGRAADEPAGRIPEQPAADQGPATVPAGDRAGGPSWRDFPVPSAGMLFATTLLVFAPAFLLAMISLAVAVTAGRVDCCASSIIEAVELRLRHLVDVKVLRLEVADPLRDAIRLLFDEVGRPPSREDH